MKIKKKLKLFKINLINLIKISSFLGFFITLIIYSWIVKSNYQLIQLNEIIRFVKNFFSLSSLVKVPYCSSSKRLNNLFFINSIIQCLDRYFRFLMIKFYHFDSFIFIKEPLDNISKLYQNFSILNSLQQFDLKARNISLIYYF
jgi:hypothetical protein